MSSCADCQLNNCVLNCDCGFGRTALDLQTGCHGVDITNLGGALACPIEQGPQVYVGNPPIDRGAQDTGSGMQFVSEYVIGQSGTLVAWEFFTFRSDTVVLQIWRATADEGLEYDLVGSTVVTASSGYNEVDANIEVQSGDVLGWFCTGVQPIVFNSGGETVRRRYGYSGTDQQVDLSGHSNGWARTYSIRANIMSGFETLHTLIGDPNEVLSLQMTCKPSDEIGHGDCGAKSHTIIQPQTESSSRCIHEWPVGP
jgi:hypothetical protein